MRFFRQSGWLAALLIATGLSGTTLVKLTVDEMVEKSTGIVRGRVDSCQATQRGISIVTECVIRVSESLKGTPVNSLTVVIPGGTVQGARGRIRQVIAGAPELAAQQEYLLFLWTGRNGITQLIGLSQGALELKQVNGQTLALRQPMSEVGFRGREGP